MYLTNGVYELSEKFMDDAKHVKIDYDHIDWVAKEMMKLEVPKFPMPKLPENEYEIYNAATTELLAASVNYCYWYGKSTIRPNDVNSTFMYECLMNALYDCKGVSDILYKGVDRFIDLLAVNRFPLLEDRIRHLKELRDGGSDFVIRIVNNNILGDGYEKDGDNEINTYMMEMISKFPGFASDMFLKRASLFFIQLNRRFGWFSNQLNNLHVPADYQIPKMLEHNSCIHYEKPLKAIIEGDGLIQKHSDMECEIRSATVLAMKKLCELTGWDIAQVDGYFFLNRHSATEKFHLTITTDY